jgi:hypothetical protein
MILDQVMKLNHLIQRDIGTSLAFLISNGT